MDSDPDPREQRSHQQANTDLVGLLLEHLFMVTTRTSHDRTRAEPTLSTPKDESDLPAALIPPR
jgi:hypothetical protein